jgi:hypothetical protein
MSDGARSHILTVASASPEATNLPSGEKAVHAAGESPVTVARGHPKATSQMWIVPDKHTEISDRPSPENDTP